MKYKSIDVNMRFVKFPFPLDVKALLKTRSQNASILESIQSNLFLSQAFMSFTLDE